MPETRVYDADQVTLSFAGILIDDGFADGEFCTVEFSADSFTSVVGTDGSVTFSKTNNQLCTVTIKLMQSSPVNERLSKIHKRDRRAKGGAGIGAFLLRDRQSGTTQLHIPKARIIKPPSQSFDRVATPREWRIQGLADEDVGGNFAAGNPAG